MANCTGHGVPGAFMSLIGIELQVDDVLYMFFDGYPDQIGGPEENMEEWMGAVNDQIDDQTVIGVRPVSPSSS